MKLNWLKTPKFLLAGMALGLSGLFSVTAADSWKNLEKKDGLPDNEVQFIKDNVDGGIFIGTSKGLASYKNGKLDKVVESGRIWDVMRVDKGKYWVGTNSGLIAIDGKKKETQLKGIEVAKIHPLKKGIYWAVTKSKGAASIHVYANKKWTMVEKFKGERLKDAFVTSKGMIWITVDGNGVWKVKDGNFAKATRELEGLNVTVMSEDSKGRVWAGLWGRGIIVLENGKWVRHIKKEKSAIFNIVEDNQGTIWVSTSKKGLYKYDGKKWTRDLKKEGGINMLYKSKDGRIWISSQNVPGLRYWDGKKWVTSMGGFFPIRCMYETGDGNYYAGGILDGLHILAKK